MSSVVISWGTTDSIASEQRRKLEEEEEKGGRIQKVLRRSAQKIGSKRLCRAESLSIANLFLHNFLGACYSHILIPRCRHPLLILPRYVSRFTTDRCFHHSPDFHLATEQQLNSTDAFTRNNCYSFPAGPAILIPR